jgi:hypothetical protein
MSDLSRDDNPYASPQAYGDAPQANSEQSSGFSKAMFIVDLVFCVIRIPLALRSIGVVVAMATFPAGVPVPYPAGANPIFVSAVLEAISGTAIAVLGLPANILGLMKRKLAFSLGMMCLLCTLVSILTVICQVILVGGELQSSVAQPGAFAAGIILALAIRVVVNGVYLTALLKFNASLRRTSVVG